MLSEDDAKEHARDLSRQRPDVEVAVKIVGTALMAAWLHTAARYKAGKSRWRVVLLAYLDHLDDFMQSRPGFTYESGGSCIGRDGRLYTGMARHIVVVDAESAADAEDAVKGLLGEEATKVTDWHTSELPPTDCAPTP